MNRATVAVRSSSRANPIATSLSVLFLSAMDARETFQVFTAEQPTRIQSCGSNVQLNARAEKSAVTRRGYGGEFSIQWLMRQSSIPITLSSAPQ